MFLLDKVIILCYDEPSRIENFFERMVTHMRTLFTILIATIAAVIGLVVGILFTEFWFGLAAFLIIMGAFVRYSITEIKANPPHVGVVTFLGKRTGSVLKEGIKFLPFSKLLFDVIPVAITKKNLDFQEMKFLTPDRASSVMRVSLTIIPSEKYIISFLNSGGMEGVAGIIEDSVSERVRLWGISQNEGPANWLEAQGANGEALAVILKSLLHDKIGTIPSEIPTSLLIKFFSTTRENIVEEAKRNNLNEEEKQRRLDAYDYVEKRLQDEGNIEEVRKAIKKRLDMVSAIRQGKVRYDVPNLGIKILRANVSDIHVTGAVATTADQQAKEYQEKLAEEQEIKHVQGLANIVKMAHPDLTSDQAFQIVMLERHKITKTVDDKNINLSMPNIPAGVLEIVRALLKVNEKGGND